MLTSLIGVKNGFHITTGSRDALASSNLLGVLWLAATGECV